MISLMNYRIAFFKSNIPIERNVAEEKNHFIGTIKRIYQILIHFADNLMRDYFRTFQRN